MCGILFKQLGSRMGEVEVIGEVIGLLSECAGSGGFVFEKLASKLEMIAGVGSIIKSIIDIFKPDEHKEIMNKLAELERKLDEVAQKMTDKFNELKAFMTEYHFYTEFAEVAFALLKHVQDTIKYPNKDNYAILFSSSQRTPPLDSVYKLSYRLSNRDTNPLVWAMNADKLMTRNTYEKWRKIIEGVMGQFLFLETYINGIFWNKNMIGPKEMKDAIDIIVKLMDKWKLEYLNNDYFWPERIERLVHETQDNHEDVGNEAKADILKAALMNIMTDSIFYVFVYNDCTGYDHHAFYGRVDHIICSFRRGKCNTVIYRSRIARYAVLSNLEQLKKEVESCEWWFIPRKPDYKDFVEELYKSGKFHNHAMVAMIRKSHDVAIRSVSNCGRQPGTAVTAHIRNAPEWILAVGYL